jgi:hypothetical protein
MKANKVRTLVAIAAVFLLAVNVRPVRAGLLSNLDLDDTVYEDDGVGTGHVSQVQVIGTTIPFQESATAQDEFGGILATVTANYSVTDNGSVATFDISCSGFISPEGYGVSEGGGGPPTFYYWLFSQSSG